MGLILALLVTLILAGAGFAAHVRWIVAAILPVIGLLAFVVSGAARSWYQVQKR